MALQTTFDEYPQIFDIDKIVVSNDEVSLNSTIGKMEKNPFWTLPARNSEPKYSNCGKLRKVGYSSTIKDDKTGKNKLYMHFQHCYDRNCPVCAGAWARRSSERISTRCYSIQKAMGKYSLFHWVYSPKSMGHTFQDVFNEYKNILNLWKECDNNTGFYAVFHPFRNTDAKFHTGRWYLSPHFHIISTLDFIHDINQFAKKYGAVIKRISRLNDLESVKRCVAYELSHAGLSKEYPRAQIGRYMGSWANSKMTTLVIKIKQVEVDENGEWLRKCKVAITGFERVVKHRIRNTKFECISQFKYKETDELFYQKHTYSLVFFKGSKMSIMDYINIYRLRDIDSKVDMFWYIQNELTGCVLPSILNYA